MRVTARKLDGDLWEVALPRRKSAIKGKNGVRPRKTVHAADEAEAIRQGRELFAREYTMYMMGLTMNLADLAVYYIDHAEAEGTYSADTAQDYRNIVNRYVAPNFAMDADQVTALDIERLYAHLQDVGGRDGDGIGPNTIHKLNTVLRATYAFITRENPAIPNPMQAVELPARNHPEKRALTEREFAKVMDGLEAELSYEPTNPDGIKRRNALFGAYLDIYIGARVGEICAITRGDVRALEETIRLEHSMSERGGFHRKEPKTQSGKRTVALGGDPFDMLRRHYEWQASYLTDAQRDSDATPVCCTAEGGFIRPRDMSAIFKAFCAAVGVELRDGESFHILRHTHATSLLSNKVNPELVRERLGHSRIETTFGYSHVMSGEDAAAAEDYSDIVARARKAGGFR
jgi:site-specific recombinase XerD